MNDFTNQNQTFELSDQPMIMTQDGAVIAVNAAARNLGFDATDLIPFLADTYMDFKDFSGGKLFTKVYLPETAYCASISKYENHTLIAISLAEEPPEPEEEFEIISKLREPLFTALLSIEAAFQNADIEKAQCDELLGTKLGLYQILRIIQNRTNITPGNSEDDIPELCDVASFVDERVAQISALPSITERIQYEPTLCGTYCYISKGGFELAFLNLLSNALKHSPSNSQVSISLQQKNNKVYITVENMFCAKTPYVATNLQTIISSKSPVDIYDLDIGPNVKLIRNFAVAHGGTLFINIDSADKSSELYRVEFTLSLPEVQMGQALLHSPMTFLIEENAGHESTLIMLSDILHPEDLK